MFAGNPPEPRRNILRRPMAHQYVFTMHRLSKVYPPDKTVLKDITLAFLPGAKIGVLGYNGAGQVDGAADHGRHRDRLPRRRDARARRDRRPARAGAAARRVQGRPGNVEDGVAETKALLRPLQRAGGQLLRRDRRRVRPPAGARSTPPTPGTSRPTSSTRWTRCACRPPTPTSRSCPAASAAASRCAACCSRARPAAARRADQPPRRRVRRLARAPPRRVHGHDRRGHPRSLLPRQRRGLDPRARPLPRASRTRATTPRWLEQKQARLAQEERSEVARQRTIAAELEWVRQNPKGRRKKAKARLNNYEALLAEESATSSSTRSRSTSRPARAWATSWSRPRACARASATAC